MSLMATKLFFSKAWVWLKHHWYVPVIFILLIVSGVFSRQSNKKLLEMIEISKESYQKQIDVINENHQKEIEKRVELQKVYFETIKRIEEEYKVKFENLEKRKKSEIKEMVEKYEGNPESLAKELSDMFGVDHVE